jgi:hypothetical protein
MTIRDPHKSCQRCARRGSSVSGRYQVMVLDTRDMSVVADFPAPASTGYYSDVAVTDDAQRILVADAAGVHVYGADGTSLRSFDARVAKVALHPGNDRLVAAGDTSGYIAVWKIETGESVRPKWRAHSGGISHLQYSHADGSRLLSAANYPGEIRVWDDDASMILALNGLGYIYSATISAAGTHVAAARQEPDHAGPRKVDIFLVSTGSPVRTLPQTRSLPDRVSYASAGDILYSFDFSFASTGCQDLEVRTWDAATGDILGRPFEGHASLGSVVTLGAGDTGGIVVSLLADQALAWDQRQSEVVARRDFTEADVRAGTLSPNGRYVAVVAEFADTDDATGDPGHSPAHCGCGRAPSQSPGVAAGSDLAEVTRQLVVKSLADGVQAPAVVAIGEHTFREALELALDDTFPAEFPVPDRPSLVFRICTSRDVTEHLVIDTTHKLFRLTVPLVIDIEGPPDQEPRHRLARIRATLTVTVRPRLTASTDQRLELVREDAQLDGDVTISVIDRAAVAEAFGPEFDAFVRAQIESIRVAVPEGVGRLLPEVLASIRRPDPWKQSREYELLFRHFRYAPVEVLTDDPATAGPYGYLFLVFSLVSHNFPPPCRCDGQHAIEPAARRDPDVDPRRWSSFAVSEDALNVLAAPHRSVGDHTSKRQGNQLYWEVNAYYQGSVSRIEITGNQLRALASLTAGGSARAGLRFPPLNASTSLGVTLTDVRTTWDVALRTDPDDADVTSLYARPTVEINAADVDVTFRSPLPDELDDATEAILGWLKDGYIEFVRGGVLRVTPMELLYDVLNTRDRYFRFVVVETRMYERSCLVVVGDLILHRGD